MIEVWQNSVVKFLLTSYQKVMNSPLFSFLFFFNLFQGQIEVPKEKAKLENKKETLIKQLNKLTEAAAKPDYETKVPEKVRKDNSEKVRMTLVIEHNQYDFRCCPPQVQHNVACKYLCKLAKKCALSLL